MLTAEDQTLIEAAKAIITRRYRPHWHAVGCALRMTTGAVHLGVNIDCHVGRIAVCAEAVAIGRAITEDGHSDIRTIVAVRKPSHEAEPTIVSPCGMCREMINDYAPDASVIIVRHGVATKVDARDLLPDKFLRTP